MSVRRRLNPRRFAERLQGWKQKLVEAGFEQLTWEDAMDLLLQQVGLLAGCSRWASLLLPLQRAPGAGWQGPLTGCSRTAVAVDDEQGPVQLLACARWFPPPALNTRPAAVHRMRPPPMHLDAQVQAIGRVSEPLTLETLELNFRDDVLSNMCVMLLRMITSAEIQRRQDHFAPFIMVRRPAGHGAPLAQPAPGGGAQGGGGGGGGGWRAGSPVRWLAQCLVPGCSGTCLPFPQRGAACAMGMGSSTAAALDTCRHHHHRNPFWVQGLYDDAVMEVEAFCRCEPCCAWAGLPAGARVPRWPSAQH
jgi:hypothetical protein